MSRPAASAEALDRWLKCGPARAAVVGPAGRGKSTLLGAWSRRAEADVVFVSVNRRLGTARQDVALNQLYARLVGTLRSPRSLGERPHGTAEIRRDLAQMISEGRPDGARPLLVIVDGVEEALDWGFNTSPSFFAEVGPGVRLVVSAPSEEWLRGAVWGDTETQFMPLAPLGVDEAADAVRERVGAVADEAVAQIVRASAGEPVVLEALCARIGSQPGAAAFLADAAPGVAGVLEWLVAGRPRGYVRALKWMARSLMPISPEELRTVAGSAFEPLEVSDPADPIVGLEGGLVSLRHYAWAESICARLSAQEQREIDEQFSAHGMRVLGDVASGRVAHRDVSDYVRGSLRIHLDRSGADPIERLALVSDEWLRVWLARPEATSAFIADVDATGDFFRQQLAASGFDPTAKSLLVARTYCLLVTSSLRTMIARGERRRVRAAMASASEEESDDADLRLDLPPVGQDPLDPRDLIGDAGERARALSRLAATLRRPARLVVLAWAEDAARDEAADPAALSELVGHLPTYARATFARDAIERLRGVGGEGRRARVQFARYLPPTDATEVALGSLEELMREDAWDELPALSEIAAGFGPAVVHSVWAWAAGLDILHRHVALSRLCGGLPAAERDAGARAAFDAVLLTKIDDYLPGEACLSLCALAPSAPPALLDSMAQACAMTHSFHLPVVCAVATRAVVLGRLDEAQALVATLASPPERLAARCSLAPHLPGEVRDVAWAQLAAELRHAEGARQLAERHAAEWALALGAAPVLKLARAIGATRRTFIAIAAADPAFAKSIVAELLAEAKASPVDESLFLLAPLAFAMSKDEALALCDRLLEEIAWKPRPDLLADWTQDDLGHLAPLLARVGGDDTVLWVVDVIVALARWLP